MQVGEESLFFSIFKGAIHMKYLPKLQRHLQRGFTLIELGIAIAIAAVVVGVSIVVVPQLLADSKVSSEITNLGGIAARIQKAYARDNSYPTTPTMRALVDFDIFPANMVTGRGAEAAAVNQWGGAVGIGSGGSATQMRFSFAGVPSYECRNLLPQVQQMFDYISVAGTAVKDLPTTAYTPADVGTKCGNATSVSIVFGVAK